LRECHEKPRELRKLAVWYRKLAERAGHPAIWEARLRTAADLEQEAGRLEERIAAQRD
jgi:hypothetical protein